MKLIHKHILTAGYCVIKMKPGNILNACIQNGHNIVVHEMHDEKTKEEMDVHFYCVNTGESFHFDLSKHKYLNTVTSENDIVWHIFYSFRP